ncbi:GcrA family cell cycle regulator [Bradyrhizobium sp.]|uniref:GcrA family cell cycle regulator n=1 Tax=Bradyrhizobium sp. TaxID=376 RepID=UPI003C4C1013
MEASNWAPKHSEALRDYRALGLSYSDIVRAINERFGTAYTRSAAIGRGKRMGLGGFSRAEGLSKPAPKARTSGFKAPGFNTAPSLQKFCRGAREAAMPTPGGGRDEPVKLRCIGITPRLLSLFELEPDDCRYPYGGDKEGEAIAFCGHPRLAGSSYCAPHFHLTRGGAASASAVVPVVLRPVRAA